jgi:DNA-binding response OmpR family regulator
MARASPSQPNHGCARIPFAPVLRRSAKHGKAKHIRHGNYTKLKTVSVGDPPNTRIIALSMYGDLHYRQRMFDAGAEAYVLKNEAGAQLEQAIDAVLRGETFISPALCKQQAPHL